MPGITLSGSWDFYDSTVIKNDITMKPEDIGQVVRKALKLTQSDFALASGTATRFFLDLEMASRVVTLVKPSRSCIPVNSAVPAVVVLMIQ